MALLNYATKEITIKIVYYGPGLSGKTTNLQYLHSILDPNTKGKLLSLATEADRTLFFDFLPVALGKLRDFSIRFQLYTVPGQVRYNATRKLVLKGADAIVFVADSQREMREQNIESLNNMRENLIANNINPDDIPFILQYNKRDLSNVLSIDELNKDLNENRKYEYTESIAIDGTGVEDIFQRITKLAIKDIAKRHRIKVQPPEELTEIIEAEIPSEEVSVSKPVPEEPVAEIPIIESSRYEYPETEKTALETSEVKKESVQLAVEKEAAPPKEVIVKEIKEVPVIPVEKLDMIINGITDISQTLKELKELKDVASKLLFEVKEMRKDQKEMSIMLRDIKNNFENMKIKKSWFRFS
jgi:signal recognition particle receptor subunit beta